MNSKHTLLILIVMATVTVSSLPLNSRAASANTSVQSTENVILLHGLCRTSRSMDKIQHALTRAGYTVRNVNYPSRTAPIETLADNAIGKAVAECRQNGATKIDFVTHSMGGILVRSYRRSLPVQMDQ
jgi:triacylglycerol esterase/lipase EstA (alpha/beta hydrolase family)